ncbi:MAG TPA: CopD family protein [Bacteroidia bacterium]|nr:CopD family protein [Bacteroidia bacterium]
MEYYVYLMALHIIFMVSWFAALFYMPRLLIYHVEAAGKDEPERSILGNQFKIMQRRLWNIIAWPSMILTWVFGLWLLVLNQIAVIDAIPVKNLMTEAWFILKLLFVTALSFYHFQTHILFRRQQRDVFRWRSFQLRLWNEVATLFLFIIIFLAVPKQNSGWVWGTLGVLILAAGIIGATALYRWKRQQKNDDENIR